MLNRLPDYAKVMPRDLNKIIDALNRVGDIQATAPLEVTRNAGRVQLRISSSGFQAVVTSKRNNSGSSSSSSASSGTIVYHTHWVYTIDEVQPEPGGLWSTKTNGKTGITATEWNDLEVNVGTVVWAEPFLNGEWRFFNDGLGSSSSSSSSSSSHSSSSGSSDSTTCQASCLEVVTDVSCEGGSIVTTTKFVSVVNGQLCVSDACASDSSSSSASSTSSSSGSSGCCASSAVISVTTSGIATGSDPTCNCSVLNRSWTLTSSDGVTWQQVITGVAESCFNQTSVTAQFVCPDSLTFFIGADPMATYTLSGTWSCNGTSTFSLSSVDCSTCCENWAASLTITTS